MSYRELLLFCARHAGKWNDAQPELAEKLREALRSQVGGDISPNQQNKIQSMWLVLLRGSHPPECVCDNKIGVPRIPHGCASSWSPPLAKTKMCQVQSMPYLADCTATRRRRPRDLNPYLKAKTATDVRRLFRRLDDDGDGLIGRKDFKVGHLLHYDAGRLRASVSLVRGA